MDKKIKRDKKFINQLFEKRVVPLVPKSEDLEEHDPCYQHDIVDNFILERNKFSDF